MTYTYNPHKHVKIWLSTKRDVFLSPKNQLRLIHMRNTNPEDEIHLIFDSQLLSEESIAYLFEFCAKLNIVPLDIRDLFNQCETQEEKNLIIVYNEHLIYLNQDEKLDQTDLVVRCKDIICWIKPVYELGTIADFDDPVDTSGIETIKVERPLLMSIGCQKAVENNYYIRLNNNIIAVVDPAAALPFMKKIQQNIFASCSSFNKEESYFVTENGKARFSGLVTGEEDVIQLHCYSQGSSILIARKHILGLCANNDNFCQSLSTRDNILVSQRKQILEKLLKLDREIDQNIKKLPLEQQEKNRRIAKANTEFLQLYNLYHNDEEIITTVRENLKLFFIHQSVLCTTGPLNIKYSLFGNSLLTWEQMQEKIAPWSLTHYGLSRLYPQSEKIEFVKDLEIQSASKEKSDRSWLPAIEELMVDENKTIESGVVNLQKAIRKYKAENELTEKKTIKNSVINLQKAIRKHNAELEFGDLKFFKSSNQEANQETTNNECNGGLKSDNFIMK